MASTNAGWRRQHADRLLLRGDASDDAFRLVARWELHCVSTR